MFDSPPQDSWAHPPTPDSIRWRTSLGYVLSHSILQGGVGRTASWVGTHPSGGACGRKRSGGCEIVSWHHPTPREVFLPFASEPSGVHVSSHGRLTCGRIRATRGIGRQRGGGHSFWAQRRRNALTRRGPCSTGLPAPERPRLLRGVGQPCRPPREPEEQRHRWQLQDPPTPPSGHRCSRCRRQ